MSKPHYDRLSVELTGGKDWPIRVNRMIAGTDQHGTPVLYTVEEALRSIDLWRTWKMAGYADLIEPMEKAIASL